MNIKKLLLNIQKLIIVFVILFVLSIPTFFLYTRFFLDKYEMNGNTLIFKNSIYVRNELWFPSDDENLGKTIGIAIYGKRTITDLIWPFWVIEYKNDNEHNRIFVRGLMDLGSVYKKISNQ